MVERVDCVVIGAGVVGLAIGRELARRGREVLVLERNGAPGEETSSRNSEVIHAGIYYPTDTLKARLCVHGNALLYRYCDEHAIPFKRCGKLIVATSDEQLKTLEQYRAQALANGVGELPWIAQDQVAAREPNVHCVGAILSQSTGIIDSHAYVASLHAAVEEHGGTVALRTTVSGIRGDASGVVVVTPELELLANVVVNSAGHGAPTLAQQVDAAAPQAQFARGHYYAYTGAAPFSALVYPVAERGGLGVHVTVDLAGQVRFGPDLQWIDTLDYHFDDSGRDRFAESIARYYPALEPSRLSPSYTGVRPKIARTPGPATDFRIDTAQVHGVNGLVNLLGIDSPGLTSSLAIAARVADGVL